MIDKTGHNNGSSEEPPETKINWTNWLIPFEPEVWFVLLATIVMSCFVYQYLEYMGEQRHQRSMRQWTMDNLYLGCMNFTQNFEYEPNTLSVRVFPVFFSVRIHGSLTNNYCKCSSPVDL